MQRNIDSNLLGHNVISFWPEFVDSHMGVISSPSSVYNVFREVLDCDIIESTRMQANGMSDLLRAVLSHCFHAASVSAPHAVQEACL